MTDYPHWYNAYIATIVVSVLPNVLLFLIPSRLLLQKNINGFNVKHLLLCFAAAGLLGDVFIHTIPHLLGAHGHDHDHGHSTSLIDEVGHGHVHHSHGADDHHEHDHHSHADDHHDLADHRALTDAHSDHIFESLGLHLEKNLVVQLIVVLGFLVFLMAEKFAKQYCVGHSHDHSHAHKDHDDEATSSKKNNQPSNKKSSSWLPSMYSKLQSSGWLNLFADSMHNFTDGIAIGASFANSGSGLGFATFVSVVCHEIPHEIGDFTILVNNGLSKLEAIKAQFITAIAALIGTAVGLLAQRNETLEQLMLAFSAGGFLYIATVNILPEIVNEKSSLVQVVCEFFAFTLGIVMMVLVAVFE